MDEIVEAFLLESQENLEQLDQDLLTLEADAGATAAVASAFRALHTIKGTCGFFGFPHLEALTHQAETLLGTVRDGGRTATPAIITLLLEVSDRVRAILAVIEAEGTEPEEVDEDLLARVVRAVAGEDPGPATDPAEHAGPTTAPTEHAGPTTDPTEHAGPTDDPDPTGTPDLTGVAPVVPAPTAPGDATAATPATTPAAPPTPGPSAATSAVTPSVRVGVPVLDELMGLVGELVLARNQILQHGEVAHATLGPIAERIDQITSGLQTTATRTRMQPVRTVFATLPRTARDVAYAAGKQVQVLTEGEETELDRTVLDAIRDPLTHLIRNAVDHGIETPEQRRLAGKPATGTVLLRGSHTGGQVTIEVIDDGGGIDHERVLRKAQERGLLDADRAGSLGHREALELIFLPGFSTAAAVTNVSGRGVGMDVVRTNVEAIGGQVQLDSTLGVGSTFRITLPLTLAIIPALVVRSGGQAFAVPQSGLQEILQLGGGSGPQLEQVQTTTVVRHRDRLLPVARLAEVLGTDHDQPATHLVLLRGEGGVFGIVVDEVLDTVEIVVKPLRPELRALRLYSGVTVLGDGTIALILDVAELSRRCRPITDHTPPQPVAASNGHDPAGGEHDQGDDEDEYLVAQLGSELLALPLGQVDRIEEFDTAQVEWVDDEPFVQCRHELLRLRGDPTALREPAPSRLVAVVLAGDEPRTALCVHAVDEVARGRTQPAPDVVLVTGRLARVLDRDRLVWGGTW